MKTRNRIVSTIAGLGLAGGALLLYVNQTPAMFASQAAQQNIVGKTAHRPVVVANVRFERNETLQSLPGVVAPETISTIAFRVSGKIHERRVEMGDAVRAGEIVARLDDTDLRLQHEAANAELSAARTSLAKAEINLARVKSLESGGWASNRASDDETVASEEARSRLLRAERNAELVRNQLDYATLRADADGVVTEEFAEVGQVVSAGQPILKIANDGMRDVIVAVPEGMFSEVRNKEASVDLWSGSGARLSATLRELSPLANAATRTFEARYAIDDPERLAALGMSATVWLKSVSDAPTAGLPVSALHYTSDGPAVWVVDVDGKVNTRGVDLSSLGTDTVRVLSGLVDGEQVVIFGAHKLSEGEVIRPVQQEG